MASELFIRRCRNWYAKLVRLYPKSHRERFGEEMEQTFNDLCGECVKARRGLFSFVLWIFFETSAGILRENGRHIMMQRGMVRSVIVRALILILPVAGIWFGRESEWNWGLVDVIFLSPLLFVIVAALGIRFLLRRPLQIIGWSIVSLGVAMAVYVPLRFHVWLPDVVFAPRRTLATTNSSDGNSFQVVQYWNHADFYSTVLLVTPPNAPTQEFMLDGDDSKTWDTALTINETTRVATVALSQGRTKSIPW